MKGDVARGKVVFNTVGKCNTCHVVNGEGKDVGPNLSEIGSKLSREAFFESILFPSAGISHNYETWTAITTGGNTITGILVSQTPAEVQLKGSDAIVRTIPRSELEELVKQPVSLMPADLQKTMTAEELVDVIEYSQTLKKK
jgi:putative heme-binding domain-containing protein